MQKRKEKCNSNLTVTKITKVHNWMFRNFSDHCLHLLLKKIVSWQTPYREYQRSGCLS